MADERTLSPRAANAPDGGRLCLALETSTASPSVALLRGDAVLDARRGPEGQHHSESLLPMVDAALAAAGCRLDDVEAFAVSIGPGAFTGLRIGLATVKGLAFGSERPAVAVSSLAALALAASRADPRPGREGEVWVPVLDARRGEVYAAAYPRAALRGDLGALESLVAESVYAPDQLARALPGGGRLVGEGAAVAASTLLSRAPGAWSAEPGGPSLADAVAVGLLGAAGLAAGRGGPVAHLVPRYVRRAEAEVTRTAERFEAAPAGRGDFLTRS